jgi:hypothetical protein
MPYAIGSTECVELDCRRERASSANGRADGPIHYSRCWEHTALRLSNALGSPRSPETPASTSVSVPASAGSHKAAAVGTSAPG